jgi:hypothetical protein
MVLLLALVVAGCGSNAPRMTGDAAPGGPAPNDAATRDATTSADMTRGATAQCSVAADCRLFASYCPTAPCQCLPLGAHQVDPPCLMQPVICTLDPCLNKKADCVSGSCTVH